MVRWIARRTGQAMLGTMFVKLGYDAAREPGMRVVGAAQLGLANPETAVRWNGAAMVAGGSALVLDVVPRLAAAGLVGSMIPTTLAGHAYWKHDDGQRAPQQIQFLKNVGLIGGLLAVIAAA